MNNQDNPLTENKTFLRRKLLLVFVVILMIPVFFVSREVFIGFAQTKDKKEVKRAAFSFSNEPVEIVSVGNSRKTVKLNEKFTQDMEWLKGFKVIVKNKFNKDITYILLKLEFPETTASGNIMVFPLNYGNSPIAAVKNEKVEAVKPGKTVELALTEKNYEQLRSFIETRHLLDDLSKAEVRVGIILFEDGTGWSAGDFVRQDPDKPGKFIPLDSKELGGNQE